MLECSVFIEDNATPSLSFKRFVLCNLYVGLFDRDAKPMNRHIYLCVVTANKTFKYRVFENVKRIVSKELFYGKTCIEFGHPSHCVLIRCNNGKLATFFRLFERLCDESKIFALKRIPIIPADLKFVNKAKANKTTSSLKEIICKIPCVLLRNEALKNVQILHLPNNNLKNIPVQLGYLGWSEVNLESNNLIDDDLLWLEELPIRRTLTTLNLSKNKITSFPPALVDFYCLAFVNFRDNLIQSIPGRIGSFQCLRNLNLSNNKIRCLPASITDLKLDNLDLTENYLTCNIPNENLPLARETFKMMTRLEDLASIKIDSSIRRKLTNKECPRRLLEKLRCTSQCICGKKSMPSTMNEYYISLPSIRFSSSFCIHPQKSDQAFSSIFLQYHFCTYFDRCDCKKFQKMNSPYFSLM